MTDNTLRNTGRDDLGLQHDTDVDDTEPATGHDVGEGGAIGLVGGAVVGGLAGGPLGAVIGGVVGGLASAGAVDVVDQHDHDYNRTAVGNTATGTGVYTADSDYDTDYRTDYQTRYASTGAAYDQYQPAYHYGRDLAADPRYQNGDWNTVETGARADWESRHLGEGTWDRFKDSVRYAWDRARGHAGGPDTGSQVGTTGGTVTGDGTTVYTTGSNTNSTF